MDVYAFGMTVLEMVTGIMPYHECTSTAQIYRKVLSGSLPPELDLLEKLNPKCCSLVRVCLQKESSRPSATELLSHEFFRPNEEEDFLEVRIKISKEEGLLDALAEDDGSEDDDDDSDHGGNNSNRVLPTEAPALSPKIYQVGAVEAVGDSHLVSVESLETSTAVLTDSSPSESGLAPSGDKGGSSTRVKSRLIQMLSPTPKAGHNNEADTQVIDNNTSDTILARNFEMEKPLIEKQTTESTETRAEIFVLDVLVVNSPSSGGSKSIRICLRVSARKESKEIDVEFEFDLEQDNTESVALEMRDCEELKGVDIDASAIVEAIDPFVESARIIVKNNVHDEIGVSLSELVIRNVLNKPENAQLSSTRLLLKAREEERRTKQSLLVAKVDPFKPISLQNSDKEIDISSQVTITSTVQLPSPFANGSGRMSTAAFVAPVSHDGSYDDLDEDRVLPIDIDDVEDENDPEYLDIITKAQEIILKIEKDYSQKLANSQAQLDKAEEAYRKDSEKLTTRKDDLDKQLESLMEKFRVCLFTYMYIIYHMVCIFTKITHFFLYTGAHE